ncbi:MAG: discoidin domain-containing protein [Cyanobacteriota bacterium]|nr:discoidin domain-containing protein [Cyanobacteriota bacterium]
MKTIEVINIIEDTNVNVALNKPTAQSSVYQPENYGYDPHGACNGQKSGKFGFSTCKEYQPWWQIDLQTTYKLSEIKIYNRMDCCQERALTLNILLSQDALNWELFYSNGKDNVFGGIDGKPLVVNIQEKIARFIRLQLRENDYLHLDEVEIYGLPLHADSSEFIYLEDETTLCTNFYNQVCLPSPPPAIKMVVSRRVDGLGTRLMSILSARYVCEYFGCNMSVTWPNIGSRYYSSDILQSDSIAEIFEEGKIFKDVNVPLLTEEEFSKLNTKSLSLLRQVFKGTGGFFFLNKNQTENLSQCEFITYDDPWGIVPYGVRHKEVSLKIKNYWKKLNWHQSIVNSIKSFENKINDRPYVVVHIRRGDIINRLLYDSLPALNEGMRAIFGRFLPIATAIKLILDSGFKDVVVCSECDQSTQRVVDEVKRENNAINFYVTSELTQSLSETQAATYDLIIMSAASKILTSSSSSFSICAEFSGNTYRVKASTDWENIARELIAYLDNNDNEMTNERKSLVYLHISKSIQDKQLADYYINLSKQFSPNKEFVRDTQHQDIKPKILEFKAKLEEFKKRLGKL